jgi:ribonuclease J
MKFQNVRKAAKNNNRRDGTPMKFVAIGDSVTKNLTVYEYGDEMIAVDFGIGFPEEDSFGVDFIVPDMTYLLDNAHKFKALFISHAHADHFAAVPYLLQQINIPIYCNHLTQEYIKTLLEEREFKKLQKDVQFHLFDPTTEPVKMGSFTVSAFHVNHSVPDSLGIVIETPEGTFVHMADFKIDFSPVIDDPIDFNALAELRKKDVLCLASDCLGSNKEGFIESESTLKDTFPSILGEYHEKQIFITTISSNISRIHQIIEGAIDAGRKVVPVGRSIEQSIKIARGLGYLPFHDDVFLDLKKAVNLPQDSVVYIIAGCFGQSGSSLDRLSMGEHKDIRLTDNSLVVFSSEPGPPGADVSVERVMGNLYLQGAEVLDYTMREHLHVSGHGHQGDLSTVAAMIQPKYFIPIGGSNVQIYAYAKMMQGVGIEDKRVFKLQEGDVVEFQNREARMGERLEVNDIYIDGVSLSPIVIKDREHLSNDGVFVVVVPVNRESNSLAGKVDVITRGFIYVKESKALLGKSRDVINKVIDKDNNVVSNWSEIKNNIEKDLQKFLRKETGRKPLIIVHSIFI